jgi:hypothetical protein
LLNAQVFFEIFDWNPISIKDTIVESGIAVKKIIDQRAN